MYKIEKKDTTEDGCLYRISFNVGHPIFQAHFVGNPVMPGACIVQMLQSLTENHSGCALSLKSAKNVKFLAVINPIETPSINVQLRFTENEEDGTIGTTAAISDGNTLFSKASIIFKKKG